MDERRLKSREREVEYFFFLVVRGFALKAAAACSLDVPSRNAARALPSSCLFYLFPNAEHKDVDEAELDEAWEPLARRTEATRAAAFLIGFSSGGARKKRRAQKKARASCGEHRVRTERASSDRKKGERANALSLSPRPSLLDSSPPHQRRARSSSSLWNPKRNESKTEQQLESTGKKWFRQR